MVYVTEAHPTDGWMAGVSPYRDVAYAASTEERLATARMFAADAGVTAKVLVDSIADTLEHGYEARPERLYVLREGKVLWRCGLGPFEYDPPGLLAFLKSQVG